MGALEIDNLFEQYRIRKNISISELSENTGISKSVIYRVLNGETKHPSLSSCKKIMNALDIPLSEFIQAFIMLTQRPTTLQVLLTDAVTINDEELVIKKVSSVSNNKLCYHKDHQDRSLDKRRLHR